MESCPLHTIEKNKYIHQWKTKEINQLMSDENDHLKKLHQIVKDTIDEEQLIVNNLLNPPEEMISKGQKISDKVARFGGSWVFIIWFSNCTGRLDHL
jgi:MarR-like DNA-binding transcriptional regulator SgrR of sgrS sRNA